MSVNDIPEQLVVRGTSDEDVPAILTQFQKRVELKHDLHVPPEEINKRSCPFPSTTFESVALETYSQLTLGTLECWPENTLAGLRVRQIDVTPVAPQTWNDWVEALTVMFAPPKPVIKFVPGDCYGKARWYRTPSRKRRSIYFMLSVLVVFSLDY